MEDDYLEDEEFEPNAITQESPLDEPQEEDRGLYNEHEHTQYGDEDPWLNDNMLASTPLIENQVNKAPTENDWDSSNTLSNENEAAESYQDILVVLLYHLLVMGNAHAVVVHSEVMVISARIVDILSLRIQDIKNK